MSQPYARKVCGSCIALKAKCSHTRPCDRCVRRGVECVDVERKPRQLKPKLPPYENAIQIIAQLLPTIPAGVLQNIQNMQQTMQPLPTPLAPMQNPPSTSPISSSPPSSFSSPATPQDSSLFLESEYFNNTEIPSLDTFTPLPEEFQMYTESPLSPVPSSPSTFLPSSPSPPASLSPSSSPSSPPSYSPYNSPPPHSGSPVESAPQTECSDAIITTEQAIQKNTTTQLTYIANTTQSTTALQSSLTSFLANLLSNGNSQEVVTELRAVKRSIETFLACVQQSRPAEIDVSPPTFIVQPETLCVLDCNLPCLSVLGIASKDQIVGVPCCVTRFLDIVKKQSGWLINQGISSGSRYVCLKHANGGAVYSIAHFELLGKYIVMRLGTMYDEMPPCLQYALFHFFGIYSAAKKPEPTKDCPYPYCQCKLIQMMPIHTF